MGLIHFVDVSVEVYHYWQKTLPLWRKREWNNQSKFGLRTGVGRWVGITAAESTHERLAICFACYVHNMQQHFKSPTPDHLKEWISWTCKSCSQFTGKDYVFCDHHHHLTLSHCKKTRSFPTVSLKVLPSWCPEDERCSPQRHAVVSLQRVYPAQIFHICLLIFVFLVGDEHHSKY